MAVTRPAVTLDRMPATYTVGPLIPLVYAMGVTGLEPVTSSLSSWRSPN